MPIKPENRKRYPPEWRMISWLIRYFRAHGQCEWVDAQTGQRCTRQDGEPIPGNVRGSVTVLTVMHIDHQPEHNDLSNLVAACQYHHLLYDAPFHAWNAAATRARKKGQLYASDLFGGTYE
jgi:hypothetical protein